MENDLKQRLGLVRWNRLQPQLRGHRAQGLHLDEVFRLGLFNCNPGQFVQDAVERIAAAGHKQGDGFDFFFSVHDHRNLVDRLADFPWHKAKSLASD